MPSGLATDGMGSGSTKVGRVLTLSVFGCVGMACGIIMAEAAWDPRSNMPPANRDDCRRKVRRELTMGLSG